MDCVVIMPTDTVDYLDYLCVHLLTGDALPPINPSCMRLYRMLYCPYAHRTKLVLEHKKIP